MYSLLPFKWQQQQLQQEKNSGVGKCRCNVRSLAAKRNTHGSFIFLQSQTSEQNQNDQQTSYTPK